MKKLIKQNEPYVAIITGKKNVLAYLKKYANEKWDFKWNGYTYSFDLKGALEELSTWDEGIITCDKLPFIVINKVGARTYRVDY